MMINNMPQTSNQRKSSLGLRENILIDFLNLICPFQCSVHLHNYYFCSYALVTACSSGVTAVVWTVLVSS